MILILKIWQTVDRYTSTYTSNQNLNSRTVLRLEFIWMKNKRMDGPNDTIIEWARSSVRSSKSYQMFISYSQKHIINTVWYCRKYLLPAWLVCQRYDENHNRDPNTHVRNSENCFKLYLTKMYGPFVHSRCWFNDGRRQTSLAIVM